MLVHTTPGTAASLRTGSTASLATTLVVREESLTLYGFADEDEKTIFETIQTVSGVGPRLALAMLAVHPPDAVRAAVTTGDLVALTKVPGIGKKTAARLILELKSRLDLDDDVASLRSADAPVPNDEGARRRREVRAALETLGYGPDEIRAVLPRLAVLAPDGSVEDQLRAALRQLAASR